MASERKSKTESDFSYLQALIREGQDGSSLLHGASSHASVGKAGGEIDMDRDTHRAGRDMRDAKRFSDMQRDLVLILSAAANENMAEFKNIIEKVKNRQCDGIPGPEFATYSSKVNDFLKNLWNSPLQFIADAKTWKQSRGELIPNPTPMPRGKLQLEREETHAREVVGKVATFIDTRGDELGPDGISPYKLAGHVRKIKAETKDTSDPQHCLENMYGHAVEKLNELRLKYIKQGKEFPESFDDANRSDLPLKYQLYLAIKSAKPSSDKPLDAAALERNLDSLNPNLTHRPSQ